MRINLLRKHRIPPTALTHAGRCCGHAHRFRSTTHGLALLSPVISCSKYGCRCKVYRRRPAQVVAFMEERYERGGKKRPRR